MTLRSSTKRAKPRWLALLAIVALLSVFGTSAVLSAIDTSLFELDKDAMNDTTYAKIAVLNAAVATAADGATTSIEICQDVTGFYNAALILVDAERMSLSNGANVAGGGCPAGFTFKRSYDALRGVGTTVPGAHAKAEDVSAISAATSAAADDWDDVYGQVSADTNDTGPDDKCIALGAAECTFTQDGRATSIFTSAKDYDEISDTSGVWQWRDQSVPDANELDDGFAIKYVTGSGATERQYLFFGADRFAVNGSKDAGFWFFHQDVKALDPVGTADGLFSGKHTAPVDGGGDGFCNAASNGNVTGGQTSPVPACDYDDNDVAGDILALTTFTGGGAVTTIRLYEWVGPSGSVAALLERATAADCVPGPVGNVCATVNNTTVETAWTYSGKGEPANDEVPAGGLLEGGIDLTALNLEGCFSSFMATTRSAPSLTADPKDFILGNFEACGATVTTTPKKGDGTGLAADSNSNNLAEVTIGTNGQVQVTDSANVNVSGTSTFTGTLAFYICGPIANPTACDNGGVSVAAAGGVNPVTANGDYLSASVTLTRTGRYCWFTTFTSGTQGVPGDTDDTIESATGTGECFEVLPVAPTLSTTATNNTSGTAALFGTAIDDLATLSGTARQPVTGGPNSTYPTIHTTAPSLGALAGGTIEFRLYGPASTATCTDPATGVTGNRIAVSTVTVSGDSVAGPPPTYKASTGTITGSLTPPAPGTYYWRASYSGNGPNTLPAPKDSNNAATFTTCGETNESSFVLQVPTSIQTAQWIYPNDDATISATAGGDLVGSVQFRLFDTSANCLANTTTGVGNGGLLYEQTRTITDDNDDVSGADSETVSTTNTGTKVTSSTTVYWRVLFTSGNTAQEDRLSNCTENTLVTFSGNNTGSGVKP